LHRERDRRSWPFLIGDTFLLEYVVYQEYLQNNEHCSFRKNKKVTLIRLSPGRNEILFTIWHHFILAIPQKISWLSLFLMQIKFLLPDLRFPGLRLKPFFVFTIADPNRPCANPNRLFRQLCSAITRRLFDLKRRRFFCCFAFCIKPFSHHGKVDRVSLWEHIWYLALSNTLTLTERIEVDV
jgi:hypothetical protein